jgi:hypothetical protein
MFFSTSANARDMVNRSTLCLALQSEGAGHAILIDSSNNISLALVLYHVTF